MAINKLNTVLDQGPYGASVATINTNFELLWEDLALMRNASIKCKGLFPDKESLTEAWKSPEVGDWAGVGSSVPCQLWMCNNTEEGWVQMGTFSGTLAEFTKYATLSQLLSVSGSVTALDSKIDSLIDTEAQARDAAVHDERTRALMAEQSIKSLLNASIDYAALPTMSYDDLACYGHPTHHVVTKTSDGKTYVIGILETFASGDGNVITQTLKTRCKLDENGNLNPDALESGVQVYERSRIVDLAQWYKDNRTTVNGLTIDTNTYTKGEVDTAIQQMRETLEATINNKADKSSVSTEIATQVQGFHDELTESLSQDINDQINVQNATIANVVGRINNLDSTIKADYWSLNDQRDFEQNYIRNIVASVETATESKYLTIESAQTDYVGKDDVYTKEEINKNMYTREQVNDKLNDKANKSDLGFYYTKLEVQDGFVAKTTNDHGTASDTPIAP